MLELTNAQQIIAAMHGQLHALMNTTVQNAIKGQTLAPGLARQGREKIASRCGFYPASQCRFFNFWPPAAQSGVSANKGPSTGYAPVYGASIS
jgi:hypothetical protein